MWITFTVKKDKKSREKRVAKGQENLQSFVRQVFGRVCPTFLLLSDEDRAEIRRHIQVETFTKGETIYREGDPANAFFIVREGEVTLSTARNKGRSRKIGYVS